MLILDRHDLSEIGKWSQPLPRVDGKSTLWNFFTLCQVSLLSLAYVWSNRRGLGKIGKYIKLRRQCSLATCGSISLIYHQLASTSSVRGRSILLTTNTIDLLKTFPPIYYLVQSVVRVLLLSKNKQMISSWELNFMYAPYSTNIYKIGQVVFLHYVVKTPPS